MSFFDRQRLAEFVNREAEMARFGEMLDNPEAHVFVVWGPGGVGKSSLQAKMWHEVATRGLLKSEVEWTETRNHDMVAITRKIRDDFALPAFDAFTNVRADYYPESLRLQIDKFNDLVYSNINNGVYRAGFATSQTAYEQAFRNLFDTLEELEQVLSRRRYLAGNTITEADWRLFCTLIRFDAVYYSHFKCNWRHIYEYPNLSNYLRDLYQVPGVAETVSIEQIKRHYYGSQRHVNPTGIVPVGPQLDFAAPHDRARFG